MERIKQVEDIISLGEKKDHVEYLHNASWPAFYQLSTMREGLFNWYEFNRDASCLYISNGYGAMVDLLCRSINKVVVAEEEITRAEYIRKRGERYKNLIVLDEHISDLKKRKTTYDYVIVEQCVQTREQMRALLYEVLPLLSERGRLLFCCENRLGMKYLCGVPDSLSDEPFVGIRESDHKDRLTRNNVIEILKDTKEILGWKLYYPAPDEKLPQAIYTDEYLPMKSIRDRVIPYYVDRKTLIALEDEISDALIENGVYSVFANSFLVECSKNGQVSQTIFAALSTDRGEEHGFATVIDQDGSVRKKALYTAGKESRGLIYNNAKELQKHGIACVEQTINCERNEIQMPYMKNPTLINYLKVQFQNNTDKVEAVFDALYEKIQQSSEQVPFEVCNLKGDGISKEEFGIVLKKAYIDMIPYNCFYVDGQILFYDQEFVKENCPAKYVLFRALRYTYIYIPEAESRIPLQYFKDRYQLNNLWNIFEREEAAFVEDNRNYNTLEAFYKWASVDRREIDKHIKFLQNNNMERVTKKFDGTYGIERKRYTIELYKRDYRLNAIKKTQLELLKEVIRICEENDISYCAFYGTLLGTVRHKGYVPWDDDMDIAMPRVDYDKFMEVAPHCLPGFYFLQTPESDPECFYGGYAKLRDNRTTGIEERNRGHNCNQGIWIDIFPLDEVLLDEAQRKIQYKKITHYQRLLMKQSYPERRILCELSKEEEGCYGKMAQIFSRKEICEALHDTLVNFGGEVSTKIAVLTRYWGNQERIEYDALDFEFLIKAKFEDTEICIPCGYENILRLDYGINYMVYPKKEERIPHHKALFDAQKSYVDYLAENGYNV